MSRFGVSFTAVAQAAEAIQSQGEQPTIEKIRNALGTGSNTTIGKYLNEWRLHGLATKAATHHLKSNAPDPVKLAVEKVWQEIAEQAQQEIATINEEWERKLSLIEEAYQAVSKERDQLQAAYAETSQRERTLFADKEMLTIELRNQREEVKLLNEKIQGCESLHSDYINGSEKRLEELQRLHSEEITRYSESLKEFKVLQEKSLEAIRAQSTSANAICAKEIEHLREAVQQAHDRNLELERKLTTQTNELKHMHQENKRLEVELAHAKESLLEGQQQAKLTETQVLLSKEILTRVTSLLNFNLPLEMTCTEAFTQAGKEMRESLSMLDFLVKKISEVLPINELELAIAKG